MASSEEFLEYVLDLLRDVPGVTHRKMMGEYADSLESKPKKR